MQRVLIVGATSAIAMATARLLAERGDHLVLASRSMERMQILAQDLEVRGAAGVELHHFDALVDADYTAFATQVWGDGVDMMLVAHGSLPDQMTVQDDPAATRREMQVNAVSVVALLAAFAGRFEANRKGSIVVISSVAGDRGRQSNYVYGAAKATLTVYLQGLRNRLSKQGVTVLTVKPGFVDTPMTSAFSKGLLWAQPQSIARGILLAVEKRKSEVYLPWFWRYIMLLIKLIPEWLFKKLSL
jgi:decaprenylphospho-beta-D-erythro-pentofuranosid-2-ulose 2-reductase